MHVLLISMPFSTTKWPSLGLSLLKSVLMEADVEVTTKYFNMEFASRVSLDAYEEVCLFSPQLLGERLFAEVHFGKKIPKNLEYDRHLLASNPQNKRFIPCVKEFRQHIPVFLNECLSALDYENYDIIGFTTMFEQTMPSIALASMIKHKHPESVIVFGGANCSDRMGVELHRSFSCIDYVCRGEAEYTFTELVKRLQNGETVSGIEGLVYRNGNETVVTGKDAIVHDLNHLPVPDYKDYFLELASSDDTSMMCEEIHMETSRGCWWGAKNQCRFCGLNAQTIDYRSKQAEIVLKELDELYRLYCVPFEVGRISMVDNILDFKYFNDLIPALIEHPPQVDLFYEVKSNLTAEQIESLSKANIRWVQPGIESLSDDVLKLMNKGVSALQNIQLLKDFKQHDIYPTWNIIYGFPGEKEADYEQITDLIPSILHLSPPEGVTSLALQRFSPYFNDPEKYGLTHVRPESAYEMVYPFGTTQIENIAYFFDYDLDRTANNHVSQKVKDRFLNAIYDWIDSSETGASLSAVEISTSAVLIRDTRSSGKPISFFLHTDQKEVYQYCSKVRKISKITQHLRERYPNIAVDEIQIKQFLDEMISLKLITNIADKYLSLAVFQ